MKDLEKIRRAVEDFIRAGDTNDTALLDKTLHSNFQNVQNGFFDEAGIFVFSKDEYRKLVETKRFGGSVRTIEFLSIEDLGNVAQVKVFLESKFLKFTSYVNLVYENGHWTVIHNIPKIEVK